MEMVVPRNNWFTPQKNPPYILNKRKSGLNRRCGKFREEIHYWFIKKNPTRCNNVSRFYYSIFIWSSKYFGRHTAHRQEPKTALAASGFSYVEGCCTCSWWTLSGIVCLTTSTNYTSNDSSTYKKPEAASAVLGSWWWAVCRLKLVDIVRRSVPDSVHQLHVQRLFHL
jgi:hypothetical protein